MEDKEIIESLITNDTQDVLNTFANSLAPYLALGTFYNSSHLFDNNASYSNIKNSSILSNVGLPVLGELFSADNINLSSNSITNNFALMNTYDSKNIIYINSDGVLNKTYYTDRTGTRPVIYLRNNLNITSGDGTENDPYEIEVNE